MKRDLPWRTIWNQVEQNSCSTFASIRNSVNEFCSNILSSSPSETGSISYTCFWFDKFLTRSISATFSIFWRVLATQQILSATHLWVATRNLRNVVLEVSFEKRSVSKHFLKLINNSCIILANPWTHTTSHHMHFDTQWKLVGNSLVVWMTLFNLHTQRNRRIHAMNQWEYSNIWVASSNSRSSCFVRGLQTLENNKNLGATPVGFHFFYLEFGTSDETLNMVFELLLPDQ